MKVAFYYFGTLFFLSFVACSETGSRPKSMIGLYQVELSLDETNVKEDIQSGLSQAKEDIQKGFEDLEEEWSHDKIPDTSTIEGKLEYTAKEFGKNLTKLGKDITEILTIKEEGQKISNGNSPLSLNFDAELTEDGKVNIKTKMYQSLLAKDYHWTLTKDTFYLYQESKDTFQFVIRNKTDKGFTLENETLRIQCLKKEI